MGYRMDQGKTVFSLPKENEEKALAAVQALIAHKPHGWVDCMGVVRAHTLDNALEACRWPIARNNEGDIVDIEFTGQSMGCEDDLFEVLAPFVDCNSYIQMWSGDDGDVWRWMFDGCKVTSISAKMIWE